MKLVAAVFAVLLVASSARLFSEDDYGFFFKKWVAAQNRTYLYSDFQYRFQVFKDNLDFIRTHNEQGHSYTLEMNEWGDMTFEEFKSHMGIGRCYNSIKRPFIQSLNAPTLGLSNAPESIDWDAEGKVSQVKDQRQCGSCYAFSAVGAIEAAAAIKFNKLQEFSEQQVVDCSSSYGNNGCHGGLMDYVFEYVKDNKGLCSESDYDYKGYEQSCASSECTSVPESVITGYKDVAGSDEDALKEAVALGPVSVAIEADSSAFQFYKSGVMDSPSCGTNLDHGVLAVGYGVQDGKLFWKVKNSWGKTWGDKGYILIGRKGGKTDGVCGIAMQPSYPTF